MVERSRNPPDPFHRKRQYRIPLHRIPAMLKAEGSYILPDNVPSNEFLNLEGDKISTSRNWAVWLHEYLAISPANRTYPLRTDRQRPETKDNDFTWKDFQARNNNELVAVYGNFVNRAMVLTQNTSTESTRTRQNWPTTTRETLKEFADVKAEVKNCSTYSNSATHRKRPWTWHVSATNTLPTPNRGNWLRQIWNV